MTNLQGFSNFERHLSARSRLCALTAAAAAPSRSPACFKIFRFTQYSSISSAPSPAARQLSSNSRACPATSDTGHPDRMWGIFNCNLFQTLAAMLLGQHSPVLLFCFAVGLKFYLNGSGEREGTCLSQPVIMARQKYLGPKGALALQRFLGAFRFLWQMWLSSRLLQGSCQGLNARLCLPHLFGVPRAEIPSSLLILDATSSTRWQGRPEALRMQCMGVACCQQTQQRSSS